MNKYGFFEKFIIGTIVVTVIAIALLNVFGPEPITSITIIEQ